MARQLSNLLVVEKAQADDKNLGETEENTDQLEGDEKISDMKFTNYKDESQLDYVMTLVGRDLSEPYSIFTYRYFLHRFPTLCIFAVPDTKGNKSISGSTKPIGCVVCKIDEEGDGSKKSTLSGYIAMLAVDTSYRRSGIGTTLVKRAVQRMRQRGCSSVTLETEVSNKAAIRLYEERLGFVREELLVRYYLNWGDAYRLRLWFE